MLAVQQLLADIATVMGSILAIGAFVGVLSRLRPVRWLFRQTVTEPIGEWFGRVVSHQLESLREEFKTNGGTTFKDAMNRLEKGLKEIRAERAEEATERHDRQVALDHRLISLEDALSLLGPLLHDWRRSHPEIRPPDLDDDGGQT